MEKLAILNKVRSLPIPPIKNILNVAVQTARQAMPEAPNKEDYVQPNGPPTIPPRPSSINFSDGGQRQQQMEHHELNPFGNTNPFGNISNGGDAQGTECTSFLGDYEQGYQRSENYLNRFV